MASSVFSGNWSHTMDAKGRVTIPASYRDLLGENFTVGLNSEQSAIALYPAEQWAQIEADLSKIPMTDALGMRYVRMIIGNSFPDSGLDAQGRVLLPATLRQKVGLDKSVRFVGMVNRLEAWDEARYMNESEAAAQESVELLSYVNDRYFGVKE